MDYKRIYNQLIQRAESRVPEGYVERHHIHPLCMGGNDEKENLVALYPEEHFVAHVLLLKIYKNTEHRYALAKAVHRMTTGHEGKRIKRKLYGWLKREHSRAQSVCQSGIGNSQHGSMWICNVELKENKKIPKDSEIPYGWIKGRNLWNKITYCKICEVQIKKPKTMCDICRPMEVSKNLSLKQKGCKHKYEITDSVRLKMSESAKQRSKRFPSNLKPSKLI